MSTTYAKGTLLDELGRHNESPQRLYWAVIHFRRWAASVFPDICGEHRISQQQANVLYFVRTQDASMADIARQLFVAPTVITGLVDRLERGGYLVREPDPTDRRKVRLVLTDTGHRASVEIEARFSDFLQAQIDLLADSEQIQLSEGLDVLVRIIANLESSSSG